MFGFSCAATKDDSIYCFVREGCTLFPNALLDIPFLFFWSVTLLWESFQATRTAV